MLEDSLLIVSTSIMIKTPPINIEPEAKRTALRTLAMFLIEKIIGVKSLI